MIQPKNEMGNRKLPSTPTLVLVMAYEDEPAKMLAVAVTREFVAVRRPEGGENTVSFSNEIVFEFDEARYEELQKAFSGGGPATPHPSLANDAKIIMGNDRNKKRKTPGRPEQPLKIDGDWTKAVRKALKRGKPPKQAAKGK